MIEQWNLAWMILVSSPFYWYLVVTLTFDLLQGEICCCVGDHNSSNLLVSPLPRRLSLCLSVGLSVCLSVRPSVSQSTRCPSTPFSALFSVVFWDIDLKFGIWICLHITQIKFDFGRVWPTFTWVIALCKNFVFRTFLCHLSTYWVEISYTVKTRVKYATAYSTRIQKAVRKVGKKPSSHVLYAGKKWENDSFQKRNFASYKTSRDCDNAEILLYTNKSGYAPENHKNL